MYRKNILWGCIRRVLGGEDMIDINKWMQNYQEVVTSTFDDRVLFIGLQGSYGRNEATDSSDIDVVLILDKVSIEDLKIYKQITNELPYKELLCGFLSGKYEIANWCKYDLFQFYNDTVAIKGKLEEIIPAVTEEDARQAIVVGACNIYHACSHNFLHTMNINMLSSLYKSSFFVLQAKLYCETGKYIRNRLEMKNYVNEYDSEILQVSNMPSNITEDTFEEYSKILLTWSGKLICQYKDTSIF